MPRDLHSFPTRRSSDLAMPRMRLQSTGYGAGTREYKNFPNVLRVLVGESEASGVDESGAVVDRSEEHTSELQSLRHLVCRLMLEKKNSQFHQHHSTTPR